jgi:hexulose-6-phosphate isomerase
MPIHPLARRTFLQIAGAALAARPSTAARLPIRRAVEYNMLPKDLSIADKFRLAKDAGFEQIECPTTPDAGDANEMKANAEKTGLRIHSVMNMDHWKYPLSSPDPEVVNKSLKGIETSLRNAHLWGADTVLVVPAVVNPGIGYAQAYERSQIQIRKVLPLAEELKVIIAVEEVWNKFLLSPVEFAKYVDEFHSPWLRAYFDVGNVVLYGYPQDWIRTLGKRIVKLHIKDFTFKGSAAKWVGLGEGDIDWKAIHQALSDIGYQGSATVELSGGDGAYLAEVNKRFEKILSGEM